MENKFEKKSKNASHTGFIWIKKTQNKVSMLQSLLNSVGTIIQCSIEDVVFTVEYD